MVDPYGRFVAKHALPEGGALTLVADVPLGTSNAISTRLGDWVGWLSLVGYVAFSVFMEVTRRRRN
jgi:apolipoprotein N-acyltransferase